MNQRTTQTESAVWMQVSADQALEWLKASPGNRRTRPGRVEVYEAEMRSGRWRTNGASIVFDRDGLLLDGHHRLLAQVRAGCDLRWLVVSNVDRDSAAETIDCGSGRVASDAAAFSPRSPVHNSAMPASKLRGVVGFWVSVACRGNLRAPLKLGEMERFYNRYGRALDELAELLKRVPLQRAEVGATLVVMHDSADVRAFAEAVAIGANLSSASPALALRNHLLRVSGLRKYTDREAVASKVIRACRAWQEGREFSRQVQSGHDPAGDLKAIFDEDLLREFRVNRGRAPEWKGDSAE